jgi:hypothetical protein
MDYQEEYNQMMREGGKNQQKFQYIVIGVIAFVLGFGIAWVSFKSQDGAKIADNSTRGENENRIEAVVETPPKDLALTLDEDGDASTVAPTLSNDVSLSVLNQAPGKSVFIKEVSAPQAVWVVIAENNDGVRGNILGAGLFDAEDQAGLVELLRGTVEGGSYYAVLYSEDSDLAQGRVFDLETDVALVDASGSAIEVGFTTSSVPE